MSDEWRFVAVCYVERNLEKASFSIKSSEDGRFTQRVDSLLHRRDRIVVLSTQVVESSEVHTKAYRSVRLRVENHCKTDTDRDSWITPDSSIRTTSLFMNSRPFSPFLYCIWRMRRAIEMSPIRCTVLTNEPSLPAHSFACFDRIARTFWR